ncbi:hypothetical protein TL5118_02141 [Thalassovita autumnalis]|uniref:DUF1963 domain-containing protein n=1 Tax=Thalassovita autumnalis TaxID=2072972 RepID=A0A0P1FXP6_9RHOB|nr:hypothetical protein [Thalassovita autumnalis]MCG7574049.1 hypothetical protein [Phaeobacter sp. CNT1-3]CUH67321.1 hypothetical protein TL5118_02141 [Thalassovita autumnalis]CUH73839.1 hypothetical protein TL5120_03656 [Thalassovita autumnalis]
MKLPEFKIVLEPRSEDAISAQGFDWADDDVGTRSKVGGAADLPAEVALPNCPSCTVAMTFVSQLDSIGDSICFADAGLLFTFVCFDCFEAASIIHSS